MTCYIIDDDEHAIHAIIKYADKLPYLNVIGSHTNPLMALEEISKEKKPDIVFLDVEMPELSGIDVADVLDKTIAVVFTTAHAKYALQAFQKDVVDFLLKPFSFNMFVKCLDKINTKRTTQPKPIKPLEKVFINSGIKGKIIQIAIAEILYIESLKHMVCIHTINEDHLMRMSIKKIEGQLPNSIFVRIHRAYIVNIDHINAVEGNNVTLNKIVIPLGELYKNNFMESISHRTIKV
jgi:two-component system LytT family response regulator